MIKYEVSMHVLSTVLLASSLLFIPITKADDTIPLMLLEAETLIENAPASSLEVVNKFLEQKDQVEFNKIPTHATDKNKIFQRLINTIRAHMIIARAQCTLHNHEEAWEAIAKARFLIEENGLVFSLLELSIIEARLYYYLDNNSETAQRILNSLISELPPNNMHRPPQQTALAFEAKLLNAIIFSESVEKNDALHYFENAYKELPRKPSVLQKINYQIALGNYFLTVQLHEKALSELLSAYWLASENDYSAQIAQANMSLTQLFNHQRLFEQALQHANQAAEYFERHKMSRGLRRTQQLIGDIYHAKERYNFALVHYFNAMDIEDRQKKQNRMSDILVDIADTYFRLERYSRTQKYLKKAITIAEKNQHQAPLAKAYLLQGEMALKNQKMPDAVKLFEKTVKIAKEQNLRQLLLKVLPFLSLGYEKMGKFKPALESQRYFEQLNSHLKNYQQYSDRESFKHSQKAIEQQLLLQDMQRQQVEDNNTIIGQKKINLFLLAILFILISILWLRHHTASSRLKQLQILRKKLLTNTRTGLRNLQRLSNKSPQFFAEKRPDLEQSYLVEMIHQPLSDKLRFAMFEVPFLEKIYLEYGYDEGLKIEHKLGSYFNEFLHETAKIYHFSDTLFIYIEPNTHNTNIPERLSKKIECLIKNFIYQNSLKYAGSKIYIGMAEIPFLPRAVTTIGDSELIDILLLATHAAQDAGTLEKGSQWVHLSAIDSTPAAYFAKTNLRDACMKGINSGFIKVKTSAIQGINWKNVHKFFTNTEASIEKHEIKAI